MTLTRIIVAVLLVSTAFAGSAFATPTATTATATGDATTSASTSTTTTTATDPKAGANQSTPEASTSTPTEQPDDSNQNSSTEYWGDVGGDPLLRIVDVHYSDGTMRITFEADVSRQITVTAPTGSTAQGAAEGNLLVRSIPRGKTTVRIDSPEPKVWLTTPTTVSNGKYTEIRAEGGSLLSGPYTAADLRDVGIGAASGAGFGMLVTVLIRRLGLHRGMRRLA